MTRSLCVVYYTFRCAVDPIGQSSAFVFGNSIILNYFASALSLVAAKTPR